MSGSSGMGTFFFLGGWDERKGKFRYKALELKRHNLWKMGTNEAEVIFTDLN